MNDTKPVDEAAVVAVEQLIKAQGLLLFREMLNNIEPARIITKAYAEQQPPEFDAFDRKHYPSFDAPVAEVVERLFRLWGDTLRRDIFGIDKVTTLVKDAFQEYDLRHKYYGSCIGQTPEMLMSISHRRRLTAEREVREKLLAALNFGDCFHVGAEGCTCEHCIALAAAAKMEVDDASN